MSNSGGGGRVRLRADTAPTDHVTSAVLVRAVEEVLLLGGVRLVAKVRVAETAVAPFVVTLVVLVVLVPHRHYGGTIATRTAFVAEKVVAGLSAGGETIDIDFEDQLATGAVEVRGAWQRH